MTPPYDPAFSQLCVVASILSCYQVYYSYPSYRVSYGLFFTAGIDISRRDFIVVFLGIIRRIPSFKNTSKRLWNPTDTPASGLHPECSSVSSLEKRC